MKRALSFHPGYTLLYEDAGNSTSRQIEQIKALARQQIDLLIVSPNETESITQAVDAVFQQGIPVVVIDRRIGSESYHTFIGGDNVEIGRMVGAFVGNLLGGKGKVIEVKGLTGSSPARDRHRGFQEQLARFPGVQVIGEFDGQWEKDTARHVAARQLAALRQANLVFAHNDVMALGVYEVCKQNGLTATTQFVGIDALPGPRGGMQLVADGILKATFLYPNGGEEAIETAVRILEHKAVPREISLNSVQVDPSNVRALKTQSERLLSQQQDIEKQSQRIHALTQTYLTQRNTLYVMVLSLLIAIALGAWAFYLVRSKQAAYQTLARQTEEIRQQKDRIEAVSQQAKLATEEKLRFYSYISHEFNTPLSLILTPTEDLLSKRAIGSAELKTNLALIQKNAHRLVRLVDQILDLRKSDSGKLSLKATEQDIISFTREIVYDFQHKANRQRIDLQFLADVPSQPLWFEREKLDKVLFNLLSNAFKYTPKGGLIHIRVTVAADTVSIQVKDNGDGMTPEEQANAFDLFYTNAKQYNLGNGLGLALTREFVHLHHGSIDVQSTKGKGTIFTIRLLLGKDHLQPTEIDQSPSPILTPRLTIDETTAIASSALQATGPKTGTLLIVEDNDELRQYLRTQLSDQFEVITESNAELGWERILDLVPDLIISDVMLPGLDGLELTQRIRSDFRTSTIPVILLTAKGQTEHSIEGIRAGADAYIPKPFALAYLRETINTTLANRAKWQNRYKADYLIKTENRQEKKFLHELTTLIEHNLSDPSFGVERLSREMGFSRVQLYRKVQALSNKNINDYFTEIRLAKAKVLLSESSKTIAEVAYDTGFSSPANFTTFFKQHTQKTPSEYRRSPVND